jgi:hypothetical protein
MTTVTKKATASHSRPRGPDDRPPEPGTAKATHPARPRPEHEIDFEALHKDAVRRYPKVRAHLAE